MINCQSCGTPNLDASQYCDECGARLINSEAAAANDLPVFETRFSDAPVFKTSNVTSVGIPNIAQVVENADRELKEAENQAVKSVHATLIIERNDAVGTEFQIAAAESLIGRWDADNGIFPDVDLDKHDPEAKISRRHARILHKDGQYA
ncbi:MAG: hypothetical protein M3T96_03630, partial [Acidobacteriota bacterium]|nr:hypothetical protein [Acidobacteriota bacterium]